MNGPEFFNAVRCVRCTLRHRSIVLDLAKQGIGRRIVPKGSQPDQTQISQVAADVGMRNVYKDALTTMFALAHV
jgi:hypothetical protein